MSNFKEKLKKAICNGDIHFLNTNKNRYSVDERFEDENDDTLLLYSLSDNQTETYLYFLNNNADSSLVNEDGETVVHSSIYSGDIVRVKKVTCSENINLQSKDGTTPLILATALGYMEIVHFLVEEGADVNLTDIEGNSPAHVASASGYLPILKFLVENGAKIKVKTKKGNYPLSLAINNEKEEVAKYLISVLY